MLTIEQIIASLYVELPCIFTRKTAETKLGKIISARTLANLDSMKKGPPHKYLSNTVVYERETFLQWLKNRLSDTEGKPL